MDTKIHSRNGHHDADNKEGDGPKFMLAVPNKVRDNRLVEQDNCKAMAAGISKILRAEPLPSLYLLIDPDGPALLK